MEMECRSFFSFFFNDTAPTEIYTLSLHDALPIWRGPLRNPGCGGEQCFGGLPPLGSGKLDRKRRRLPNGFELQLLYAGRFLGVALRAKCPGVAGEAVEKLAHRQIVGVRSFA